MTDIAVTPDANLRWIRTQVFGMQQDEFASLLDIPRVRLSKYENGHHPVPKMVLDTVRQVALKRGLDFSSDWFFEAPAASLAAGQA